MDSLQATWRDGCLFLWGRRGDHARISSEELRSTVGDAWDTLLVSGAGDGHVELFLPVGHVESHPESRKGEPSSGGTTLTASAIKPAAAPQRLAAQQIPALVFSPAEALELLTSRPRKATFQLGDSFTYWTHVASLLTELLADQRFVPAIHHSGDSYRGYWRVVIEDTAASSRLSMLIASMPPVCRAFNIGEPVPQASELVENFLWTTTDAVVRRCLEGDELVHATYDNQTARRSLETKWLHSLVSSKPVIEADRESCQRIHATIHEWIGKLEPAPEKQPCRTCFQLHEPEPGEDPTNSRWKITVHVQATGDPSLVIDADMLWERAAADPFILARPFASARELVIADIEHAGRHFAPVLACLVPESTMCCEISVDEAYTFLRDVAPLLKVEGFGVWLPRWWQKDRPRLHLQLDLRPAEESGGRGPNALGLDSIVSYDWRIAVGDVDLSSDELQQLTQARHSLVHLRGRWMEVQAAEIQAANQFAERNRHGRMTILESLRHCYLTEHSETGLPIAGIRAHGWVETLLESSSHCEQMEVFDAPGEFEGKLRPYQLNGVRWLAFLTRHGLGACLADDMGLGKTIQLIALLLHERRSGERPGPTLLIVPMSLVGNWQREIERFAPSMKVMVHHGVERLSGRDFADQVVHHDVVISTYGLTHRDYDHLAAVDWYRIALDEAQNIKNPAAKQSKAVRSLRSIHRLALTGTPVENRLSELWGIMEFLNPSFLGSARDFRRRFAVAIERQKDSQRTAQLRKLIQPFVLRRKKSDPNILEELPPKLEMQVFCNLTREQAVLYERIVGEMIGHIDTAGGIQRRGLILATLTKLKQICNHPVNFLGVDGELAHRSGKCDRLVEMLEEALAEGDRALVFTQFRETGKLLKRHIEDVLDCTTYFLHGGTSQKERDRMVQTFQNDEGSPPVFLLSLKAGGFGLNLTRANHVFHFDRWWNPAVEDQATDRVHRIGQHKQVQVHRFVCVGTLEERIDAMINQKRNLAEQIVGSGEDWITELSTDALREVFALSRDAVAEA